MGNGDKIRNSAVAGAFYPADKAELESMLAHFEKHNNNDYEYKTRAIIAPHAGYVYSGQLASEAFECLDKHAKTIFIFAPAHRVPVSSFALSSFDFWETPLGKIEVDQKINRELIEKFGAVEHDEAHAEEHAAEVQVPFVQRHFKDAKIVPVLVGEKSIAPILEHFWEDKDAAFVISSDLSHFHSDAEAKKIDSITAQMIENLEIEEFQHQQACGATGICGLVEFACNRKFTPIRIGMTNSGEINFNNGAGGTVAGDKGRVVGYGAWLLYDRGGELGFAHFVSEYFANYAKAVCKRSILSKLENKGKLEVGDLGHIPPVFAQVGAVFVTLRIEGDLRGCIGSIVAHRTLIQDLIENARSAAFSDPRFEPLTMEEFNETDISISILTAPKPIEFKGEADLLEKIVPNKDGIIIREGRYQAVYLPSVWEELPDKVTFLNSLKRKAGLNADYFSDSLEVFRFHVEEIK